MELIHQQQGWGQGSQACIVRKQYCVWKVISMMKKMRRGRRIRGGWGPCFMPSAWSLADIRAWLWVGTRPELSQWRRGGQRAIMAGLSASRISVFPQKHDVQHPRQQAVPRNRPQTSRGRFSTDRGASEGGTVLASWPQHPRWASAQIWAAFRDWVSTLLLPEHQHLCFRVSTMQLSRSLLGF